MAKKPAPGQKPLATVHTPRRPIHRRALFLPRLLFEESRKAIHRGLRQEAAFQVLKKWAQLGRDRHLDARKETSLDDLFLTEIFAQALDYPVSTVRPDNWNLELKYSVPGIGTADGALGDFRPGDLSRIVAVIELKDAGVNLDRDKFNGRTPVQQCWDYLNALPDCPWGIVSNFATVRLYHRDKTPLAYEEFVFSEFLEDGPRKGVQRMQEFWYLLERDGLFPHNRTAPRAQTLLEESSNRQREVGDKLYDAYSQHRYQLIAHLMQQHARAQDEAIRVAQRILDRIIFIAFCEDRQLLPPKVLKTVAEDARPLSRVTNPVWRNFLDLFESVDQGNPKLGLTVGYNGGLFRRDPAVDDLQLDDEWTNFFKSVGDYDFRDEVNVDVLGNLFERSIGELEKFRSVGLFSEYHVKGNGTQPAMPKSAERKRFGIYYTPPEFTTYIVEATVNALVEERFAELRRAHRLTDRATREDGDEAPSAFWHDCLGVLRSLCVCDPACGSGAFLIRAYDVLEEHYYAVLENLIAAGEREPEGLDEISDYILRENLYGADLSAEAVEITQLALWIRSARRGRTLADLSRNIVCRNSLVTDPEIAGPDKVGAWTELFADVFAREERGFDCVIGNPPWERLKLQEREFFAFRAPKIAGSVSAADRRKLILKLESGNPLLFAEYKAALSQAERVLSHVRSSGHFPLTGKGDVNTYALFAELAKSLVAPHGRVGLLVPSGIATDNTTREFFSALMDGRRLIEFHDFENKAPVFPDVHRSFKFGILVFGGAKVARETADFSFFSRTIEDLDETERHIAISGKDLRLLNPNTRTCAVFRSRRDAQITKAIYRRVPVLIDENRKQGGNPWDVRFFTMFHQTNDAELFQTAAELKTQKLQLDGNRWLKGKRVCLPLYEAKMVQAYDHRAAGVLIDEANWVRQGQTEATTLVAHQNPEFTVTPRWWVAEEEVDARLDGKAPDWFLAYKDVTSPTNQRTMIAAMIPKAGVVNSAPLMLTGAHIDPRLQCCLLANLNSFAYDFVARQKVGGVHLNFFIVNQLPTFPPEKYEEKCPWSPRQKLVTWISNRVLKLTCTANDLRPLAQAAGLDPPVHRWQPAERAQLEAELDAAYFRLYGIGREDMEYVLSTFAGTRSADPDLLDSKDVATRVLEAYEHLGATTQ
jgi:hypothetical protein